VAKSKWSDQSSAKELIDRISQLQLSEGQKCVMILRKKEYKSAFDSQGFDTYILLLKEIARFDNSVPEAMKSGMIKTAIWKSADNDKLNDGYVGNVLKRLETEYLKARLQKYVLVTGISINGLKNKRVVETFKSKITVSSSFPQKFKKSFDFKQAETLYPSVSNKCYSWVTVEVHARCIHSATELAFLELDFWRGIMNIYFNYNQSRVSFSKPAPINKILKYPYQSLHLENGDRASDFYWFDPSYSSEHSSLNVNGRYDDAKKLYTKLSKDIIKSGEVSFFVNILNRYCSALDSNNMNAAFLSLWSVLEALTFTGRDTYDVTISRALVLFKDRFKFNAILSTLRKKRNMAIHSGSEFEEAEEYTYLLLSIIHEYIRFLMNALTQAKSSEQLKGMLDLPIDAHKLLDIRGGLNDEIEKIDLLEKLIKIEK
jgi:hypothetical protein